MTRRGLLLSLLLPLLISSVLLGSDVFAQPGGVGDPDWAPVVTLPDDSTIVWCEADSICYDISARDPDATDSISMSLVSGPIEYTPRVFGQEFRTTVCFWPETSGEYRFIWRFVDRQNHVVVDTVVYTIEAGTPPILEDQSFYSKSCDLRIPEC